MNKFDYYVLLRTHDWHYDFSDDHNAWNSGRIERDQLLRLAKKYPELKQLYDEYYNFIFNGGPKPEAEEGVEVVREIPEHKIRRRPRPQPKCR